ncbi:MAG: hypothetical protein R3E86_07015 [Pseudomonadales bacterium]
MTDRTSDKDPNALLGDLESIRSLLTGEEQNLRDPAGPAPAGEPTAADDVPLLDDFVEPDPDIAAEPFEHDRKGADPSPADGRTGAPDREAAHKLAQRLEPLSYEALSARLQPRAPETKQTADVKRYEDEDRSVAAGRPASDDTVTRAQPILDDSLFRALLSDDWRVSTEQILEKARDAIDDNRTRWTPDDTDALNDALRVRIDSTLTRWLRDTINDNLDSLRSSLLDALRAEISDHVQARLIDTSPTEDSHGA